MSEPASSLPAPAASVTLLVGGTTIGRYPLDATGDNTLGRSTQATVTIPDRLASRSHAAIRFHTVRREWVLRDLGSRNGTWLAGRRVDVVPLLSGAVMRIGASEIVFECAGAAPPADGQATIDLDEPVRASEGSTSRLSHHGTVVLTHAPPGPAAESDAAGQAPLAAESVVMRLASLNLRDWQRALILEALRRHAGDVRSAAADLGVDADRLHDVLARHGLIVKP